MDTDKERQELKRLTAQACRLLESGDGYAGERDRMALRDMVLHAQDALEWYQSLKKPQEDANLARVKTAGGGEKLFSGQQPFGGFSNRQYQEIKRLADQVSVEQVQRWYEMNFKSDDYAALSKEFDLWSSTGNGADFYAPDEAVCARICLELPSEENEAKGLGHIWVKGLKLTGDDGQTVYQMDTGSEAMLFLQNKGPSEHAVWNTHSTFPVRGGAGYTMSFEAKPGDRRPDRAGRRQVWRVDTGQGEHRAGYRKEGLPEAV